MTLPMSSMHSPVCRFFIRIAAGIASFTVVSPSPSRNAANMEFFVKRCLFMLAGPFARTMVLLRIECWGGMGGRRHC